MDSFVDNDLLALYQAKSAEVLRATDFAQHNLLSSLQLFEPFQPGCGFVPKNLEVVAIVGGLPFSEEVLESLCELQNDIMELVGPVKSYFVKPKNLAIELCVLKWPEAELKVDCARALEVVHQNFLRPIQLSLVGFQVNPDGCIVVRGFDKGRSFRELRGNLMRDVDGMPVRQSQWVHIPVGRILEPIGSAKFGRLKNLVVENDFRLDLEIDVLSLVHETRWYMEKHEIVERIGINEA